MFKEAKRKNFLRGASLKKYKISLTRSYIITLHAKNEKQAKEIAEYYIGGEKDLSTPEEQKEHKFKIEEIKMTINEAIDSELYDE